MFLPLVHTIVKLSVARGRHVQARRFCGVDRRQRYVGECSRLARQGSFDVQPCAGCQLDRLLRRRVPIRSLAETDVLLSGGGAPITGKPSGVAAGITAGYDWQMPNSNWVFGGNIAAPFLTSVDDRVADSVFPATVSHRFELEWALLFTGRVGYAYGNWLPYVGAGLAVAEGKGTFSSPTGVASDTQTHVGFTVLAGIRYWLAQNWWVALQYNYVDLGSETYTPPGHSSRTVGATSNSVVA